MAEEKHDGNSWFWRIFGSTIIGGTIFLLVTVLNHLNSNIAQVRVDNQSSVNALAVEISTLKEKLASFQGLNQINNDILNLKQSLPDIVATKDRFKDLEDSVKSIKEKLILIESNKEGIKEFKDSVKDLSDKLENLRERVTVIQEKVLVLQKPKDEK